MALTYRLTDADSDWSIGGAFTDQLIRTSGVGTDAIEAGSGGGVQSGYYATNSADPGTNGTSTGTFTVVLNVSAAVASTQARCYLRRYNSAGVQQTEVVSPTGYVATTTTGDKTWSWSSPALGTWAAGDRLVLRVEVQNNAAHGGAAGPTFDHTATNTRVATPFSSATTLFGQSVVAVTAALTSVAKVAARGLATQALTATLVSVARVVAKAQATQALTATLVTAGQRALRSQATQALTAAFTTAGQRTALGQATASLTVDLVSDGTGTTPSTGEDIFGTAVMALAWDAVTDAHLAQYALPAADSVDGQWTTQANGTDLEQAIDDLVVDDSDYIRSELNPDSSACRVKLEGLADPGVSTGHVLRWRIGKDAAGGNTVNMTLSLYEGGGDVLGAGTLVASFARNDVAAGFATFEEHLSGAEADTITDYGALYLELAGDVA